MFRDGASNFQKELGEVFTDLEYDKDLYRSFIEYYEGNYKKEKKILIRIFGEGSVKLVEDEYKAFKRMGFNSLLKSKQEKL